MRSYPPNRSRASLKKVSTHRSVFPLRRFVRLLRGLLLLLDARLLLLQGRLLLELLDLSLLGLCLVERLDEDLLVLELVPLRLHVVAVVDVVIDLARLTVLAEQAAQNPLPTDPENLGRHARLGGTAALAGAGVAPLPAGGQVLAHPRPRVDLHRLTDDEAVLQELAHVEPRVRHLDLAHLVRVQPDALPAALLDGRRKAFLDGKARHQASAV